MLFPVIRKRRVLYHTAPTNARVKNIFFDGSLNALCGIIRDMIIKSPSKHEHAAQAALAPHDVELAIKAVHGIADISAGRCAPLAEVRARVLARYEPTKARA